MISSILNPTFYEADFRPIIALILIMVLSLIVIVRKNWQYLKHDLNSDWEK